MKIFTIACLLSALVFCGEAASVTFSFDADRATDLEVEPLGGGEYRMEITGGGARVYTETITEDLDPEKHSILSLEYFSVKPITFMVVYPGPVVTRDFRLVANMPLAEGWSTVTVDLTSIPGQSIGPDTGFFRLHFAGKAGTEFRIRNLELRNPTESELREQEQREARIEADRRVTRQIEEYLLTIFPGFVTETRLEGETILVEGVAPEADKVALVEVPLWTRVFEEGALDEIGPGAAVESGFFSLEIPRFDGEGGDRLLSGFALVGEVDGTRKLLSPVRFIDPNPYEDVVRRPIPKAGIKGMGGLDANRIAEYRELGVVNVGVNVMLGSYLLPGPVENAIPWEYAGRTYWMNPNHVKKLDEQMRVAKKNDLGVDLVLLMEKPSQIHFPRLRKILPHPDYTPRGIYAMPNMTNREGVLHYAAVIDFLAARYAPGNEEFAVVKDWVVHNEVDAAIVWTNAGDKSMTNLMDLYVRSMRLMHNLVRVRNPNAEVLISLTHRWTEKRSQIYAPKEMLERLVEYSHLEGDFRWGIAQHPYPTDLFDPTTWDDPRTNFTLDSPLITFRNLEVLDYWIRLPENRYRGQKVRSLALTEQGLNSKGLSEEAQLDQAAGLAYAWNKIKRLESVRLFIYHRWVDHPNEGGLQLGLRVNQPGTTQGPGEKKLAWEVYRAMGTPEEEEATAFALPIVGLENWDDIIQPVQP